LVLIKVVIHDYFLKGQIRRLIRLVMAFIKMELANINSDNISNILFRDVFKLALAK
jgi:hypothetical protein